MRYLPSLRGMGNQPMDFRPDAVDWSQVGYDNGTGLFYYSNRRITGINLPITLYVEYDVNLGGLYYGKNFTTNTDYTDSTGPFDQIGWIYLNSGDTIDVQNNDYISFGAEPFSPSTSQWVIVHNKNDGNRIIDYIDMYAV